MISETLQIGELNFEVRRSARRRTLGITVERSGGLLLHVPQSAENDEIVQWTNHKLLWVYTKLSARQGKPERSEPEFVTGEGFFYLGRSYRLKIAKNCVDSFSFDEGRFVLRQDLRAKAPALFRAWYIRTGSEWVRDRVRALTRRTGKSPSRVDVRELGYRWGSCGKHNVLLFNWRLLQLPVRMIDYVVVHELVHLIQARHDKQFWDSLDRALPDWRERKEDLRIKASAYLIFDL